MILLRQSWEILQLLFRVRHFLMICIAWLKRTHDLFTGTILRLPRPPVLVSRASL
jgi:hypothetical protein